MPRRGATLLLSLLSLLVVLVAVPSVASAAPADASHGRGAVWSRLGALAPSHRGAPVETRPAHFKAFTLDAGALRQRLDAAPLEHARAARSAPASVKLSRKALRTLRRKALNATVSNPGGGSRSATNKVEVKRRAI